MFTPSRIPHLRPAALILLSALAAVSVASGVTVFFHDSFTASASSRGTRAKTAAASPAATAAPNVAAPVAVKTLLVNQKDLCCGVSGYRPPGTFGGEWGLFSDRLNTAFGANNITVSTSDLSDLNALLSYDALLVVPRTIPTFNTPGGSLTPTEISNLRAFAATGRRLVLFGENGNWGAWDNGILSAVGGSYSGSDVGLVFDSPALTHPLTAGVNTVVWNSDGIATGGTPLFQNNAATLWGANQNALTVLSDNAVDDGFWFTGNNSQLGTNIADWLASGPARATVANGKIAFVDSFPTDAGHDLYVIDPDGSNLTNLTNGTGDNYFPAWSPDGTRIAFSSFRDGNLDIYVMNGDGSNVTRLTSHPAFDFSPSWSPDGTKIAFESERDNGPPEIYVMNADGSNQTRLTFSPSDDDNPSWSPDGSRIAFSSFRDGDQEIYVMNADGSNQTNITNSPASGEDFPSWSPDGSRIAFSSDRGGNEDVYVMNADGSNPIRLTSNPALDFYPAWSPDGTKIAFESRRDGNPEIYVMDADGSNQTNLTNNPAGDFHPDWQRITLTPTPAPTPTSTPAPTPTPNICSLVVTTTADSGLGSLRDAITCANNMPGPDAISFNIPGNDPGCDPTTHVCTIKPPSALPTITQPVTINGYSQPGTSTNTAFSGVNAVLLVELDGENAGAQADGLYVTGGNTAIRGLVINRFASGIRLESSNNTVASNLIGVSADGTTGLGNTSYGVVVNGGVSNNVIGGSNVLDWNVISGNGVAGVALTEAPTGGAAPAGAPSNNSLLVNWIGLNAAATDAVPNGNGVILTGSNNTLDSNRVSFNTNLGVWLLNADDNTLTQNGVGLKVNNLMGAGNGSHGVLLTNANGNQIGYSRTTGNAIVSNGGDGISVESGAGNTFRANAIWDNAGLGIDLAPAGVNPNDPQDADAGANNRQNYPLLTSATRTGSTQTVTGTLNSAPNQTFTIDFYQTEGCPPSGVGTGAHYSGSATVITDGNGDAPLSIHPDFNVGTLQVVATATDADGNTSEFSPCRQVTNGTPGEIQFADAAYAVAENGTSAVITVTRTGGSDGVILANFLTSDGTATAGSDYTAVTQTISYADGETGTKTVNIFVTDDSVYEGDETVNLSLSATTLDSAPPPDAATQFTATLTITENDAAPTPSPTPGAVAAWGYNFFGQLGDGTNTNRNLPAPASGLTGVVAVDGGEHHSIALKSDGTVITWGDNDEGQLGDGASRNTPAAVSGLAGVTAIASGANHSLALKSDGAVVGWGNNTEGELGDGTNIDRGRPVAVSGLSGVVAVAAGYSHSLALKDDGTVVAWGFNGLGELGDGTNTSSNTPVAVSGLSGVVAIACGDEHSLALKSDGTIMAWGWNQFGQLGDGTNVNRNTPVAVVGLKGVTAISGGAGHSLALKSDGTVVAWGWNQYGQLGDGTNTSRDTPVAVSGLAGVVALASGFDHSIALKSDGSVAAWGYNAFGQLGNGTNTGRNTPVTVSGLTGVVTVAAGGLHSLAVTTAPLCPAIALSPSSLPEGTVGVPYSQTITATGGTDQYNFAVAGGMLPDGLTLSSTGNLSGTPAAPGVFNFTVTATDINGCSGSQSYAVSVQKATPVVSWSNPADITYGVALGPAQLNATANVAGSFVYTPAAGTVLNASNGQTLSAVFTPADSSNYNAATAGVLINVLKVTAVFSNLSSPTITYGTASTTLSGKISAGSLIPTGGVSVTLNGVAQTAGINGGDGSFSVAFATGSLGVSASPYSVSYAYAGDSNFSGAAGAGTLTVSKADTFTGVSSGGGTSTYGQPVTFTATVASGGGTPTGSVQFFDGAASLGVVALSNGGASLTTSALGAGTHSITGRYFGDANFNVSVSPALTQTVNQAATSTSLTSSPNPSVAGQAVTFTAGVASGGGVPAGSVEFFDGTASLGMVSLNGGSAALTTSALGAGSHQITAVYGGNVNFLGSTSAALSQTVAAPTPAGKNVTVQASAGTTTVQLTFTNVQTAGNTTITPIDPASAGAVPGDFVINGSSLAFDIQTTATFTGKITIVFYVPSVTDPTVFNSLQIIHYVNGQPKVEKTTRDFAAKTISATVTSLSPFLIAQTIDHTPPVIGGASVTPSVLSPPNHKMASVTVNYSVTDNYTPAEEIDCQLGVSSNEPINGTGDGDTSPDWEIVDAHHLLLRSERAGGGSGRVYTITVTCTDRVGNSSSKTLMVRVPKG